MALENRDTVYLTNWCR